MGIFQITDPEKHENSQLFAPVFSLLQKGYLDRNITELVDIPEIHEKAIIQLDVDEVAKLLDLVENGDGLTDTKRYHKYAKGIFFINIVFGYRHRIGIRWIEYNRL